MGTVEQLKQRIKALEAMLEAETEKKKKKLKEVFSVSSTSNPYSGLLALQKIGIVRNPQKIRKSSIVIVGLGGMGSLSAEMLTRCGIGKLILIDFDYVKVEYLIKGFFKPHQIGLPKVKAVEEVLRTINPEVEIQVYNDAVSEDTRNRFIEIVKTNSIVKGAVDLVLSSVDDSDVKRIINSVCNEYDLIWFEAEIAKTAISGHVQCIIPGRTACWVCASPFLRGLKNNEDFDIDFTHAANLPSTTSIIAGILVQNALKVLLQFGKVVNYIQYSALNDFFPSIVLKPHSECSDQFCILRQKEYDIPVRSSRRRPVNLQEESNSFDSLMDSQHKLKSD